MCQTNQAVVRCSDQNTPLPAQPRSTCIFGTILSTNVTLGKRCVVEYSSVESGVTIGDGSIVSNMMVPSGVSIPPGCFFHTVCVTVDEHDGLFVTVLFSIKDNVKKIMPIEKMNALKYCGQAMDVALKSLAIKQEVNLSASYFKARLHDAIFAYDCCMQLADAISATLCCLCRRYDYCIGLFQPRDILDPLSTFFFTLYIGHTLNRRRTNFAFSHPIVACDDVKLNKF